jgi:GntR family transcriptional repressor for pyruvate dehydrogenase complex
MFQPPAKTEKISDHIIGQIRDAILSGRFKPGDRLASEKELVADFGVSKASMREALRVLEAMGLVEIRKGISGGIFIAEVDMKTTINSIVNFLHFKSLSVKDITMVRYIMEPPVAQLAASRIGPGDISRLENMIEERPTDGQGLVMGEIDFHRYLARLSENPVLILIMDFIDNMLRDIKFQLDLGPEFYEQVKEAHVRILACLSRKDGVGARREIIKDVLEVGVHLARLSGSPAFHPEMLEGFDPTLQQGANPLGASELQKVIGEEGVARLKERGSLFQRVGSGELYLISFSDKGRSD